MKSYALAAAALLTTWSLAAAPADQPAPAKKTAAAAATSTQPATTATATPAATTTAAATTAQPALLTTTALAPDGNSLAAAAARSNAARGAKKAKISINNENLSRTGGHITSGSANPAALPPTPPGGIGKSVEQMVADADAERKAIAEKEKKKAADEQRRRMERAANNQDGNALDANDDPAQVERQMQAATQTVQTTTASGVEKTTTQKPPL